MEKSKKNLKKNGKVMAHSHADFVFIAKLTFLLTKFKKLSN